MLGCRDERPGAQAAGLSVRPGDAEQLAEAFVWLHDSPRKTKQLGQEARRRSATYNWSVTRHAYHSLYKNLGRTNSR